MGSSHGVHHFNRGAACRRLLPWRWGSLGLPPGCLQAATTPGIASTASPPLQNSGKTAGHRHQWQGALNIG